MSGATGQNWYDSVFAFAVSHDIMVANQFAGKENSPATRSDIALLVSNALSAAPVPSDVSATLDKFADASSIKSLSAVYQNAIAKIAGAGIVVGDDNNRFNPTSSATRAEAAAFVSNFLNYSPSAPVTDGKIMIAAAASLQNVFEKSLIPEFAKINPNIQVTGTFDSSGKLQTQIESGLEADIFFSAALTQMNNLKEQGLMDAGTIVNLLENKIVLIKTKGLPTNVTSFENITEASVIAIGDPASVPAGQYAQEAFTSIGNWDAVVEKSSLGSNVTEVLSWVASGSAEVGVVYATDAISNANVEVIAEAPAGSLKAPVLYPIGITAGSENKPQAKAFLEFLRGDVAKALFESYGFSPISAK
jgi:molybdate transport system substrate-binding protein